MGFVNRFAEIEPVMKPSEQLTMLESLQFNVVLNGVEKNLTNDL